MGLGRELIWRCGCRTAYASFGGLLMALSGSYRHISGVSVGEYVYLLIRR